ncbi:hypothetical protein NC651_001670 [Populus alba x Populus x berolinensis]|nr:hypothetical protein NC651_001670 [Populus alba x Populus x berolinensis]
MQMYLSIYFQLSLLLPKLVESTFLRKLHDLSSNEAVPDSIRLVPTGLDTDFSYSQGDSKLLIKAINDGRVHAVVSWEAYLCCFLSHFFG